jgi:septum formation protein
MPLTMSTPLILASASPYRRALLEKLGLPFTAVSPAVDETRREKEEPQSLALRLATEKSQAVASHTPHGLVIGSDQVAELDGVVLSKPGTREGAIAQLIKSSGQTIDFYTAVCVTRAETGQFFSDIDTCRVTLRPLTRRRIEHYVDLEKPLDCADSFKSEGLGIAHMENIEGEDPNALVGLPLIRLIRILEAFELDCLDAQLKRL